MPKRRRPIDGREKSDQHAKTNQPIGLAEHRDRLYLCDRSKGVSPSGSAAGSLGNQNRATGPIGRGDPATYPEGEPSLQRVDRHGPRIVSTPERASVREGTARDRIWLRPRHGRAAEWSRATGDTRIGAIRFAPVRTPRGRDPGRASSGFCASSGFSRRRSVSTAPAKCPSDSRKRTGVSGCGCAECSTMMWFTAEGETPKRSAEGKPEAGRRKSAPGASRDTTRKRVGSSRRHLRVDG